MRIVMLTKRRYMGKDVIDDRYGRFYELPEELARRGHKVSCFCLNYHWRRGRSNNAFNSPANVEWGLFDFWPIPPLSAFKYLSRLNTLIQQQQPDVIIGCSDALQISVAAWAAKKHRLPLVVDLYDQFEAYGATYFPGIKPAFHLALRQAKVITCVSQRLHDWCAALGKEPERIFLLENAVSGSIFYPHDRSQCREVLGLPGQGQILLGTAGSLDAVRDVNVMYEAFMQLAKERNDIHLVVAGPRRTAPPFHPRIHDLGILEHAQVPLLFSALDVGIVCNGQNDFSFYCCPQKLIEMQACGLPVVAADILDPSIRSLRGVATYQAGDSYNLALRLTEQLVTDSVLVDDVSHVPSWSDQANKLEAILGDIVGGTP